MTQRAWGGRRVQRLRHLIYQRDHGTCAICNQPAPFNQGHIDHIIPRTDGGTDRATNLQWTHAQCNLRKGIATPQGGHTIATLNPPRKAHLPVSLPEVRQSREW